MRHNRIRIFFWFAYLCSQNLFGVRRKINSTIISLRNNCAKMIPNFPCFSLFSDVWKFHRSSATGANGTLAIYRSFNFRFSLMMNTVACFSIFKNRLHPGFFALLFREHEGTNQRHFTTAGRVGTLDGPGPDPGNDSGLTAALGGRHFHLGVQVANLLEACCFIHSP